MSEADHTQAGSEVEPYVIKPAPQEAVERDPTGFGSFSCPNCGESHDVELSDGVIISDIRDFHDDKILFCIDCINGIDF